MAGLDDATTAVASQLEDDRDSIGMELVRRLRTRESPLVRTIRSRQQVLDSAAKIIDDVIVSLRAGQVRVPETNLQLHRQIGVSRASSGVHPRESLSAAALLFDMVFDRVTRYCGRFDDRFEPLSLATRALNTSLATRIGLAATAYTGYLLDTIHEAHLTERRRVGRELHDRVSQALTAVQRQLELHDLYHTSCPSRAQGHVATAHVALHQSLKELRAITSELTHDVPVTDLESALRTFIDSASGDDVDVRLSVRGDPSRVSQAVRDEAFLILREAMRNALVHGHPSVVQVRVDITRDRLSARVEDDGGGFNLETAPEGVGLISMRERAALLGGAATVATDPGRSTRVELVVPLARTAG